MVKLSIEEAMGNIDKKLRHLGIRRSNKKRKSRGKQRVMFHMSERPEYMPLPQLSNDFSQGTFLGVTDMDDHIITNFVYDRHTKGKNVIAESFTVLASREKWLQYINETLTETKIIQFRNSRGIVILQGAGLLLCYNIHSSTVQIDAMGDKEAVEDIYNDITESFESVETLLEWIYSVDGSSIEIPLRSDRYPVKEMYPFLGNEKLEDYYDRYMESAASILLLIGPPGTGKTSFIRGLMQHTQSSAVVTYDENILSKDYVFAQFIEGDKSIMVVEDADLFLKARTDGNSTMHKFLNIGDGLVTTRNKKLIFSTNLPSIRDIDPALIRPGRCFDILNFELLNQSQAESLAAAVNRPLDEKRDTWTLAEVFNKKIEGVEKNLKQTKFGFI